MSDLPKRVEMIEVGPRDGLQIEPRVLSTAEKVRMIDALADSLGCGRWRWGRS